jgi:hypothetical protein
LQHNTARHITTQHNITQHNTTQHNTARHKTTQNNTTQHNTTQRSTTQNSTAQNSTAQHNTSQPSTTQHNTTQHKTAQHNTAQQNTTQHNTHADMMILQSKLPLETKVKMFDLCSSVRTHKKVNSGWRILRFNLSSENHKSACIWVDGADNDTLFLSLGNSGNYHTFTEVMPMSLDHE